MLQCVLQCVEVCPNVMQYVAVCCSVLTYVALAPLVQSMQRGRDVCIAVWCRVLQRVAV